MFWLCVLCVFLAMVIVVLLIRIALLHKAADDVCTELDARLDTDTNALISLTCGGRHMKRLAASLNKHLRLLRAERRQLQNGDLELKEAVVNISHDLRTPLTAICGYLDLLKRENVSDNAHRYLDVIENRTCALKTLTEELFRYSFLASTANQLTYEKVELNRALEESILAHYAALKGSGITPQIFISEPKIERELDKHALSRIFGNIISNAIKYSDGDLCITLAENGEITFSNTASRLDEIQVGKLFRRFYTVDDAKKSTGLGLSIAKILTEQMHGTITAQYHKGKLSIKLIFCDK